jgi:hypothetical protein
MLLSLTFILIAFIWLGIESHWFTIRLLQYSRHKPTLLLPAPKPILMLSAPHKLVSYKVYNKYGNTKSLKDATLLYEGGNVPEYYYENHVKNYQVVFNPGVTEPLCGFDWLNKHCNAMFDYEPDIEMNLADVRYHIKVKSQEIISEVMKVNKLGKVEKARVKAMSN